MEVGRGQPRGGAGGTAGRGAQPGSITMVFGGLFVISYGIQISVQSQLITENIALAYNFFQKTVT